MNSKPFVSEEVHGAHGNQRLRPRQEAAATGADAGAPPAARFTVTPDHLAGGQLHEYQLEGLNWLVHSWQQRQHVILADEVRLCIDSACPSFGFGCCSTCRQGSHEQAVCTASADALCCLQMGLGKTIQTIAYLSTLQCASLPLWGPNRPFLD